MSTFDSLTKVTKEEIERAVENFNAQKAIDEYHYQIVLSEWKQSYPLSWWQRNVSKLQNLGDEEFAAETNPTRWYQRVSTYFVGVGILNKTAKYTLDSYAQNSKDIVFSLLNSGKDEHYVSSDVLAWMNYFGAFKND